MILISFFFLIHSLKKASKLLLWLKKKNYLCFFMNVSFAVYAGAITFSSDVYFMDNVTIASTLNEVDIEVTSPLIVLKDTDGEIRGTKTFDRYIV